MTSNDGNSLQGDMLPDWSDDPPHPIEQPELTGPARRPEELLEIQRLLSEGWELAPDAPVWVFLPAIWPRNERTWVPDRVSRTATVYDINGERGCFVPSTDGAQRRYVRRPCCRISSLPDGKFRASMELTAVTKEILRETHTSGDN